MAGHGHFIVLFYPLTKKNRMDGNVMEKKIIEKRGSNEFLLSHDISKCNLCN